MKKLLLLFASVIALAACQNKIETTTTETTSAEIGVDSVTYSLETPPKIKNDGDTVFTSFSV